MGKICTQSENQSNQAKLSPQKYGFRGGRQLFLISGAWLPASKRSVVFLFFARPPNIPPPDRSSANAGAVWLWRLDGRTGRDVIVGCDGANCRQRDATAAPDGGRPSEAGRRSELGGRTRWAEDGRPSLLKHKKRLFFEKNFLFFFGKTIVFLTCSCFLVLIWILKVFLNSLFCYCINFKVFHLYNTWLWVSWVSGGCVCWAASPPSCCWCCCCCCCCPAPSRTPSSPSSPPSSPPPPPPPPI